MSRVGQGVTPVLSALNPAWYEDYCYMDMMDDDLDLLPYGF